MTAQTLNVALLGCGVVGSDVVRLLHEHADDIAQRSGAQLRIAGIAVRDPDKLRGELPVDPSVFTTDAQSLAAREDVDLVIELIGGIEPARTLILTALRRGASVVTGNKTLLAEDGATLHEAARLHNADLFFEASVGGAIPLLRPLRYSLAGDRVRRVMGIVNGTTNYILSRMDETGATMEDALAEAQDLGYAEKPDPSADTEGFDSAAKAAILASIAFHTRVTIGDVYREGITGVRAEDIADAKAVGAVVKLLAIAERDGDSIGVRVHPVMIPRTHPLASVRDAYNAVFVEADAAGQLMFYGRGAGGAPTASAVLGDLVVAARNRVTDARAMGESAYAELRIRPIGESSTRYHVSLDVADKPGVLAAVATAFSDQGVSIQTVRQEGRGDDAKLVIVTHRGTEAGLATTVEELRRLDVVRAVAGVMRVEGEETP
ncbi:MAG: homoserine dehydrogenase [Frankiaceae bacterium]|jgi:homoserine dehydrogenase|nr:homoserine dehydrogenase [Frankiaceae bacterium]MDQ1726739.1 homoserine dehydrogenase [Frankiaceae bacterium]